MLAELKPKLLDTNLALCCSKTRLAQGLSKKKALLPSNNAFTSLNG